MELTIRNIKNDPQWSILKETRKQIFVDEQGLDACLIEDTFDDTCTHILYTLDEKVIASCRIREDGDTAIIERISVIKEFRNQSLGKKLITQAISTIESMGALSILIHAQSRLSEMYMKYGFIALGNPFQSYGSSHIQMVKYLDA